MPLVGQPTYASDVELEVRVEQFGRGLDLVGVGVRLELVGAGLGLAGVDEGLDLAAVGPGLDQAVTGAGLDLVGIGVGLGLEQVWLVEIAPVGDAFFPTTIIRLD